MVVSFVAIVGCVAFVVLSMLNFDLPSDAIVSQLISVVLLLLFIVGLAALTGFLIHKISSRHRPDEDEDF